MRQPEIQAEAHRHQHQGERQAHGDRRRLQCRERVGAAAEQQGTGDDPSITTQKMRCTTGASTLPPAVIASITSEPESDEVMKNTSTRMMPTAEVRVASGRFSSIWNIASSTLSSPPASAPTPF